MLKKLLLKGGLIVSLLLVGGQQVHAVEETSSQATITFYDPSPVPKPVISINDETVGKVSSQPVITNKNKRLPQTNDKPLNYLVSFIGGELILLSLVILWKRRKEEEDDEQKNSN